MQSWLTMHLPFDSYGKVKWVKITKEIAEFLVDLDRRFIFNTILLVFFIAIERKMQRIKDAENCL